MEFGYGYQPSAGCYNWVSVKLGWVALTSTSTQFVLGIKAAIVRPSTLCDTVVVLLALSF